MALKEGLKDGETGVFLATAHPAKFKETVEECIDKTIEIPEELQAFMKNEKQTTTCSADYQSFREILLNAQ